MTAQGFSLQCLGVFVLLFLHNRGATQLWNGGTQRVAVGFVVCLKTHCHVQYRFLQQTAASAQLLGIDGFMLQAQSHVQNANIFRSVACDALCQGVFPREHGHGYADSAPERPMKLRRDATG